MPFRMTTEGLKLVVTGSTANGDANVDTALFGVFYALFTEWPGWSSGLTVDDLILANFDGYVGKAATWSPTYVGTDAKPSSVSNLVSWQPTGSNVDNAVIGVAVTSENNDGTLIGIDVFEAPIAMMNEDNRINYALEYGLDPNAFYGTGTVIA